MQKTLSITPIFVLLVGLSYNPLNAMTVEDRIAKNLCERVRPDFDIFLAEERESPIIQRMFLNLVLKGQTLVASRVAKIRPLCINENFALEALTLALDAENVDLFANLCKIFQVMFPRTVGKEIHKAINLEIADITNLPIEKIDGNKVEFIVNKFYEFELIDEEMADRAIVNAAESSFHETVQYLSQVFANKLSKNTKLFWAEYLREEGE